MEILSKLVRWLVMNLVLPAIVIYYVLTAYMFRGKGLKVYGYEIPTNGLAVILGGTLLVYLAIKGYEWVADYKVTKKFKLINKVFVDGDNVQDVLFTTTGLVYFEQGKNQVVILHKNKHKQEIPFQNVESIAIYQGERLISEKTKLSDNHVAKAVITSLKPLTVEIKHTASEDKIKVEFLKKTRLFNNRHKVNSQLILVRDWYARFGEEFILHNSRLTPHKTRTRIVG